MSVQDYTLVALITAALSHLALRRLAIEHGHDRATWRAVLWSALMGAGWPGTAVFAAIWLGVWPTGPADPGSVRPSWREVVASVRATVAARRAAPRPPAPRPPAPRRRRKGR